MQERIVMLAEKMKEKLQPYIDGDRAGFRMQVVQLRNTCPMICRMMLCKAHISAQHLITAQHVGTSRTCD